MNYYNSTDTCDKINEDGNRCGGKFYKDEETLKKVNEIWKRITIG